MGIYTRFDDRSDPVAGLNRMVDRDAGLDAKAAHQIRWTRFDGTGPTLVLRHNGGEHRATLLSATAHSAVPSNANSVERVTDAGLFIGAGKALRLYDAAGTDYVELKSDADGGLVLGGSGANAGDVSLGDLTLAGNLTLSGAARRILGDFSNGTLTDRTLVQTSTANGNTLVGVIPNGTATIAGLNIYNGTNLAAVAVLQLAALSTELRIFGTHIGASYLPVTIWNGGFERVRVDLNGQLMIGDTANAQMTQGLTINQGASDDEILALKSSDVAHGVTLVTETDTFAMLQKESANNGGLRITALDDTASRAFRIRAVATTANTTRSTAADGAIVTDSYLKSGTGTATLGANGNLLVVRDNDLARFLVDAEGDVHYDGTTNAAAWDEHDDVALLEAFRITTAPGVEKSYRERFSDDVRQHAEILAKTGVITLNDDGHHFVSMKGLMGLLIDAIRMERSARRSEIRELRRMLAQGE